MSLQVLESPVILVRSRAYTSIIYFQRHGWLERVQFQVNQELYDPSFLPQSCVSHQKIVGLDGALLHVTSFVHHSVVTKTYEIRTGTTKDDDSILWTSDEEAKRVAKNALDSFKLRAMA